MTKKDWHVRISIVVELHVQNSGWYKNKTICRAAHCHTFLMFLDIREKTIMYLSETNNATNMRTSCSDWLGGRITGRNSQQDFLKGTMNDFKGELSKYMNCYPHLHVSYTPSFWRVTFIFRFGQTTHCTDQLYSMLWPSVLPCCFDFVLRLWVILMSESRNKLKFKVKTDENVFVGRVSLADMATLLSEWIKSTHGRRFGPWSHVVCGKFWPPSASSAEIEMNWIRLFFPVVSCPALMNLFSQQP